MSQLDHLFDWDAVTSHAIIIWIVISWCHSFFSSREDKAYCEWWTQIISRSTTCSEDPLQAVGGPRRGSACLARGASVGRGGRRVGFWRQLRWRISLLHQHLSRTQQTHTVLTRQEDGLLHHLVTHRAMQLPLHALHVRLEGRELCEEWDQIKAESLVRVQNHGAL